MLLTAIIIRTANRSLSESMRDFDFRRTHSRRVLSLDGHTPSVRGCLDKAFSCVGFQLRSSVFSGFAKVNFTQIRQLALYISNKKAYSDGFVEG